MFDYKINKIKIRQIHFPLEVLVPSGNKYIIKWYEHIEDKLKPNQRIFRKKLFSNNVCFVDFTKPAVTLLNHKYYHNHILLDVELINDIYSSNVNEIFPVILHELGHIFNIPKNEDFKSEDSLKQLHNEYFADDYVRKKGFEKELLNSLETYKKWLISHNINDKLTNIRIDRIINKNSPYNKINKGIELKTLLKKLKKH